MTDAMPADAVKTEPVLATHQLTKHFDALCASDAVTLSLNPGEIHAVIGPNGAGKSTLIQQICGVLSPDVGRIELLGQDITSLSTAERARAGLARTFQVSALAMEDTVLQNTVLGVIGAESSAYRFWKPVLKNSQGRAQAEAALERVGLIDQAGRRCSELSHGQRRQLEVAVALTLQPKAFVMDEPMAGLGIEGSSSMTQFLDGLRNEAPILLVEHDMDAVFALADRISVLVYGKVIATGSVDDIRNDPVVQEAYLGTSA